MHNCFDLMTDETFDIIDETFDIIGYLNNRRSFSASSTDIFLRLEALSVKIRAILNVTFLFFLLIWNILN